MSARARLFVGLSLLLAVLSLCALVLFAVAEGATASASAQLRDAAAAPASAVPSQRARVPQRVRAQPESERTFAPSHQAVLEDAPTEPLETSHPLDGERARIQHELQLIGALNDALDRADAAHMRTLLSLYREHDATDVERLQEGYTVIADCLERPGEASRRAAQAFYDEARASTLRRYVRRVCLERAAPR